MQRTADHWGVKQMKSCVALFMDLEGAAVSNALLHTGTLRTGAFPNWCCLQSYKWQGSWDFKHLGSFSTKGFLIQFWDCSHCIEKVWWCQWRLHKGRGIVRWHYTLYRGHREKIRVNVLSFLVLQLSERIHEWAPFSLNDFLFIRYNTTASRMCVAYELKH